MVRVEGNIPVISAALAAPLIVVSARWPGVMHAVDMDEIIDAWPNLRPGKRARAMTAVCGARRLQFLGSGSGDVNGPIAWPPRADSLPPGWVRCVECHRLTGRKRPRSAWTAP